MTHTDQRVTSRRLKRVLVLVAAIVGVIVMAPLEGAHAASESFAVAQLTGSSLDDWSPPVSGDRVVLVAGSTFAGNTPPVLGPIVDATISVLVLYSFSATASDVDIPHQPLTYSLTGVVPTGASINPVTGVFTWTPTESQGPGVYAFTVQVSDGAGGTDTTLVTLTVIGGIARFPAVTGLTPGGGSTSGGNTVVISGTRFTGVTSVKFGGYDAREYVVNSATQITAVTPAHSAGTVQVKVTAAGGSSADTAADDYTYEESMTANARGPVVVLISGLDSNTSPGLSGEHDWDYVASRLNREGYETYVVETQKQGGYPRIDSGSSDWDVSARRLDHQLLGAETNTGVPVRGRDVILIGHSMGGLIARAYVDLPETCLASGSDLPQHTLTSFCDPIAVIMLGTPNKGSEQGGYAYWAHITRSQAAKDLGDPSFMSTFNDEHDNRRDLPMYRIAGNYFPDSALGDRTVWDSPFSLSRVKFVQILAAFGREPNDYAVSVDSVRGGPTRGWVDFSEFPAAHCWSIHYRGFLQRAGSVLPYNRSGPDSTDISETWDRRVMNTILRFVRDAVGRDGRRVGDSGGSPQSLVGQALFTAADTSDADLGSTPGSTSIFHDRVSLVPGATEITFTTEGSTAVASAVPDSGEVALTLETGEGTPVDSDVNVADGLCQLVAGNLTPGGTYVLEVGAVWGDPATAEVGIWDDGLSSLRVVIPGQVTAGEAMTARVAVYEYDPDDETQAFTISTASLAVSAQLDAEPPVVMLDDGVAPDNTAGDGIYTASVVAPSSGSAATVVVIASGPDSEGVLFERRASRQVTIREARAELTGTPTYRTELDGDGKVSALLIDVPVYASDDCDLELSGDISSLGELVGQGSTAATLAAGETGSITLRFAAADVYPRLDPSGVFTVTRLTLLDMTDEDQALLDEAADILSGTLDRGGLAYAGSALWSPAGNPLASHDVALLGESASTAEPIAGLEYSVDDGPWTVLSDPAAGWGNAEVDWSLSLVLPDGFHGVSVRADDADGGVIAGTETNLTFTVDAAAPDGYLTLARALAGGDAWEALAGSSLGDVSGVVEMRFSLDARASWSEWEPYVESAPLTLPPGSGVKTVYAQLRDAAGNEAEMSDSVTLLPLGVGWNLVAGEAESDFLGQSLYSYDGTGYQSTTADAMTAGSGYWCKMTTVQTAYSSVTEGPVVCHLKVGWNLIGNSTGDSVNLPDGVMAFTFDGDGYQSTTVLLPGEGAWIKAAAEGDLMLEP